jgi:hypothetical protein
MGIEEIREVVEIGGIKLVCAGQKLEDCATIAASASLLRSVEKSFRSKYTTQEVTLWLSVVQKLSGEEH